MTNVLKLADLSPKSLKSMDAAIEAALKQVASDFGVTFRLNGGKIQSDVQAWLRLEVKLNDPKAVKKAEKDAFIEVCHLYDLKPAHYETRFTWGGKTVTLIGFELRRRAWPIRVRQDNGKIVLLPEQAVATIVRAAGLDEKPKGGKQARKPLKV